MFGDEPKNPEPDLLAGAGRRIERHRTTAGSITLRKPNGRPILGARLRMVSYHFPLTIGNMSQAVAFACEWSQWWISDRARAGVSQNGRSAWGSVCSKASRLAKCWLHVTSCV